jgi:hypothetical protein
VSHASKGPRGREVKVEKRPQGTLTLQSQVSSYKTSKKTRRKPSGLKKQDIDRLVEELYAPICTLLSLTDDLGLPLETSRQIIRDVVEMLTSEYSSKPSADVILKKIRRNLSSLFEYVVSKLLELLSKPTPQQLEYLVMHGSRVLIPEVERLYKLAVHYGRLDLVDHLRYIWNTYGPRGMIECPKCRFNAITPDNSCCVCGHVVTEEYIRSTLGFSEKFELYIKSASVAELTEVLKYGYVLVGEKGVYYPKSPRARRENSVLYLIHLTSNEASKISEEVNTRELKV